MNMQYSQSGLKLTESFEGVRLTAYQDSVGVWTIGWGHTGDVYPGETITVAQAEAYLLHDIQHAVSCVNAVVTVQLTQGEFDACTDFAFNVGCHAFATSTLLKLLNSGDYQGAAAQFERWDKAGGVVVAGLLRRRLAEEAEFNVPPPQNSN